MTKKLNTMILIVISLNIFTWSNLFSWKSSLDNIEIWFLDIGQGDSTLIKTPQNNYILIDGGPGTNVSNAIGKVFNSNIFNNIDVVISTHPDKDHIEGLNYVLNKYNIQYYFINKVTKESELIDQNLYIVNKNNIKNFGLNNKNDFIIDGVIFNILWPTKETTNVANTPNNHSISLLISYKDFRFLTMGDADSLVEELIIKSNKITDIDLLKVSHHGSKYSTSNRFVKSVSPDIAVISVGKNNYGHPTNEVINNLTENNVKIFRTDRDNTVKITSDGKTTNVIP